jgi:hypothetical protein
MLVILASAVFSIAGKSREVASRSVALHSLNESLRAATVVRAQATFAAYLAANDATYGTNSGADIKVAVTESRRNLTDLKTALAQSQPGGKLDAETAAAVAGFTSAADKTLSVATGKNPTASRALVGGRLVPTFDVLRDRLVLLRDSALTDVKQAGSLLGRLGGLASFVIAFVLPTVTVLVYRQITRRSRETVEIARSLALERGRTKRRQLLLARSLADLQAEFALVEAADEDSRAAALRRLGWEVDALETVVTGPGQLAFSDVSLATDLPSVTSSLRYVGIDVTLTVAEGAAWADPDALAAVVRNLVLEAESAGALRIEIESVAGDERVDVRISHNGAALSAAVSALVFDRAHDEDRSAVEEGSAPIRLLAAQDLVEAMGGSLAHLVEADRPTFIARLPRGGVLRVHTPVDLPARAVAPA